MTVLLFIVYNNGHVYDWIRYVKSRSLMGFLKFCD